MSATAPRFADLPVQLRCVTCGSSVGAEQPLNETVEIMFLREHYGHHVTVTTPDDTVQVGGP